MKYKVSYSVRNFEFRESVRQEKIVEAINKVEAVRVILIETKGSAMCIFVEEEK